jgi:uncharacterized iron-regulated membrane protein
MLEFMIGLVALWPLWLLLLGVAYWWRSRKGRWLPVRKQAA